MTTLAYGTLVPVLESWFKYFSNRPSTDLVHLEFHQYTFKLVNFKITCKTHN